MTLYKTTRPIKIPEGLTADKAKIINQYFIDWLDETQMFNRHNISDLHSTTVKSIFEKIESDTRRIMSDLKNQPATQELLVEQVSTLNPNCLLDVTEVVNNVRRYNDGTPYDEPEYSVRAETFKVLDDMI